MIPFWGLGEHEPFTVDFFLSIVLYRDWRGPWTVRGIELDTGMVIYMTLNIRENESDTDPFLLKGSCNKCRKRLVVGVGYS